MTRRFVQMGNSVIMSALFNSNSRHHELSPTSVRRCQVPRNQGSSGDRVRLTQASNPIEQFSSKNLNAWARAHFRRYRIETIESLSKLAIVVEPSDLLDWVHQRSVLSHEF
jgi:hypothetical protein